MKKRTLLAALLCVAAAATSAHEYYARGFTIVHPWAEATAPGARSADVFLRLEGITADDRLIGARSSLAARIELRGPGQQPAGAAPAVLTSIALAAGSDVALTPEGAHLTLLELTRPLQWGFSYPLTLVFEKSGEIDTMLSVGSH